MKTTAKQLKPIYLGFLKISESDRIAYLKFLDLKIQREKLKTEKDTLLKFKSKLEKVK